MEEACNIFAASAQNGVTPTEFTFANVVIWGLCFGLMEEGTQIHCLVNELGGDVIVYTTLTYVYCKLRLIRHARKNLQNSCWQGSGVLKYNVARPITKWKG
jgi:hypothetical protein